MKIVLIRGLPGSGKSTMAKAMGIDHFEADQYFVRDGSYRFDASELERAHTWCQKMAFDSLSCGRDVVISNTFSRLWELKPYVEMATLMGADLEIIEATGSWPNVHGVPESVIQKMRDRWEPTQTDSSTT